jgi:hypothetical protein
MQREKSGNISSRIAISENAVTRVKKISYYIFFKQGVPSNPSHKPVIYFYIHQSNCTYHIVEITFAILSFQHSAMPREKKTEISQVELQCAKY